MINSTGSSSTVQIDMTAVIRSAGERTKDLCYRLLCEQLPPENIIVIEEYPFTRALRQCFQVAIAIGRAWTLCVDADTLLRQQAVENLLGSALETDECIFRFKVMSSTSYLLCRRRREYVFTEPPY